jgi:hypothetical protein
MIDLRNETPLSLSQAAKTLPPGRRGQPVTLSCLLRWILNGVKTPDGVVRLEAIRMGRRWITSIEALERFADKQTPRPHEWPHSSPSVKQRQRASQRAERDLEKMGI